MTSLINFIDTGFIITLGLLILISGLVMLYCYRRLNLLENSVIEHGKILQNFIVNYNNQTQQYNQLFKTSNLTPINEELCDQNFQENNEENENNVKKINLEEKIDVSDEDSDDEDSGEDDSGEDDSGEDDSDEESESDEDNKSDNTIEEINNNSQIQISDIQDDESLKNENFSTINLDSSNEEEDFLNNVPINFEAIDLNMESKIIDLNVQENDLHNEDNKLDNKLDKKKNYTKMKVDDLRVLVVTNNLISNEDAQTMKKNDLIKLIQQ